MLSAAVGSLVSRCVTWLAQRLHSTPIGRIFSVDLLRYAICGVANYIVIDAVLYFLTYHYLVGENTYINIGITTISPHIISLILVFPVTLLTGFWLNRHVVFNSTEMGVRRQMSRYLLSIAGSIVLSYLIIKVLVEMCGIWPTPAKVLCSLTTATYSYLMARLYTFRGGTKKRQDRG